MLHTHYISIEEVLINVFNFEISNEDINSTWDLYWADTGVNSSLVSKMKPYQKVNHFPAMYYIAHKNHLAQNLMKLRKILPDDYSFFPKTWLLPADWLSLRKELNNNRVFIVKPEARSQGKGIFLAKNLEDLTLCQPYVVQKYVKKPLLIDGYKFDLRIYALVYGCDPLRIFVYNEGLARLATEPYISPSSKNMDNYFVHLTNYAINKNSENYVFNSDAENADVGSKRSLSFVWNYIDSHGGDSIKVKDEINGIIIKTLCSIQPILAHGWKVGNG